MEDDIEDVPASSASERGEKVDDGEEVVADSGEILMPDSVPEEKVTATPIPQGQTSLTRQQTSAARLLSSIQPLKRRRLFVSPGLITSSPPGGKPSDNIEEGETDDKPIVLDADSEEEEKENEAPHMEPSTAFAARFQRTKSRQAWERDDDIVDNESSSDSNSDGHAVDNEGIRDIVNYGELLEYGDSSESDLGHARAGHDHDDMDDDMVDEDEDAGYDEGMMLDMTPPRVRRARLLRLQRQQQQQLNRPEPMQRLPTFQRARMFLSARKPAEEDGDMDNDTGVPIYNENDDNENLDALTTPARQRHYDALRAQPPPDFFSPQKKRRQKRKSRGRYSIDGDELASPSTAATNDPEQYVPGGLAAGLRDWLVQIKRSAPGMSLATGRRQQKQPATDAAEDGPPARLLLAGEGRRRTQEHIVAEAVADGHPGRAKKYTVSIAHPAWEVVLGGQPWIVASDWSMQEE
ncbi:hypothetical protein SEUCBS140593_002486 [Sporothrix eucalyptigena]|uniref:DNA replication checkpoint mediator MRC1 domain-containing protein n=1 Tax=Sporothrix eucalyptigena TaxID=1812306 RepID=A0ABP0B6V2_9PEZI